MYGVCGCIGCVGVWGVWVEGCVGVWVYGVCGWSLGEVLVEWFCLGWVAVVQVVAPVVGSSPGPPVVASLHGEVGAEPVRAGGQGRQPTLLGGVWPPPPHAPHVVHTLVVRAGGAGEGGRRGAVVAYVCRGGGGGVRVAAVPQHPQRGQGLLLAVRVRESRGVDARRVTRPSQQCPPVMPRRLAGAVAARLTPCTTHVHTHVHQG